MTVTFFGHRNTPSEIQPVLEKVLTDLIENSGADNFYVGNQGAFDTMVRRTLKKLKSRYEHINYSVVLAYMPVEKDGYDYTDTVYPSGLEKTPTKFAIVKRNEWMINHSDTVIVYVKYIVGGAAQFKELSEKKDKKVINLFF